ncbi:MAG: insulinase family protein [Bacteroidetes bacterium]|nr:insulinase family protein [Bacteroidota bacterium]
MKYEVFTLQNGIRLIHMHTDSRVAHCGMIINAGTRDETIEEHGIAHFIEHVIFKGTSRRKAYHICSRMEDVGGEIDAFTSKENTCIIATFLDRHYERAIELISDILFRSTFPEKEIIKEKEVIYDEINSYKDSPAELIFDDFEELIFDSHPIGRSILGSKKTIRKFTQDHIHRFIANNYFSDEMVFCSVGNIRFEKLKKLITRYFDGVPANRRIRQRTRFDSYIPQNKTLSRHTYQAHCIIGNIAYEFDHDNRLGLGLLSNILGGPGMNSRLNLLLREKHGLVYNVESSYSSYVDTGLIGIYFGTEKENLEKSIRLIHNELKRIRTQRLGKLQLHRAKQQMLGHIAISADNNANLLLTLGKSLMLFDKVDSLEEIAEKIEIITASGLMDIANEIFDPERLSMLIYK